MNSLFAKDARVVGLVARNSPDYFNKFFDIVTDGGIVVPLRGTDDMTRIEACGISEVIIPESDSGWIERTGALPSGDRVAQIAFTSGTQGEPKGVILTQANLADRVERVCKVMQLDASVREYIGVPIYHAFGFGRCRIVAAIGGKSYLPRDGFNPGEIARMLEAGEINAISAVPTLWRSVLRNPGIIGPLGERVRWIEIGSQPMSKNEKLEMRSLFPNARIFQHYGLTEASATTLLDITNAGPEELESVGVPSGDTELSLTDEGLIRIRGSHVAAELLVGGQRVPNSDAEGWFTTKDLGEIRDGKLYFIARADDMLNLGGLKVSADLLEVEISQALGISDQLSVVRIPDPDRGEGVLLAVTMDCTIDDDRILARAQDALKKQGISLGSSIQVMRVDALPRTESGKVKRNELADLYGSQEATPRRKPVAVKSAQNGIFGFTGGALRSLAVFGGKHEARVIYQEFFPNSQVGEGDSFVSLGGDSLTFVELSIALEAQLGRLPVDWQNMSIAELRRISPQRGIIKYVDTTIFLRCIAICGVVAIHFTALKYFGAAFMFLLVAGFSFSRFQLRSVITSGNVKPILLTAARVAVPAFCVFLALQILKTDFQPDQLFLISNFFKFESETWFVEAYVQVMLLLSLLFALPGVRALARRDIPRFTVGALVVTFLLAWMGATLRDWPNAGLAEAPALSDHVPYMVIWVFFLGCLLEQTSGIRQKLVACLLAGIGPFILLHHHPMLWIWTGCLFLLFTDRVPIPSPLNWAVYWIGGASLFIYITHWTVVRTWQKVSPVESDGLEVLVALLAGIAAWTAWETGTGLLMRHFWSRRQTRPIV